MKRNPSEYVRIIFRVVLKIVIICLVLSCLLTLIFGTRLTLETEAISTFIWIFTIAGIYGVLLTMIEIVFLYFVEGKKAPSVWQYLKPEIILLLGLIGSLIALWLCGLIIY